jgi:16S rRNA (cytosine967-C5)-methyltransferase
VALAAVLDSGTDSQAAVDAAVRSAAMVPTDKRLCTELVYGTLRRYLRLEWFAGRFLRKPEKLPGELRLVLLMALNELAFLRIPPHATLGWAVSHARHRFGQGLAGVTNGVLRSMQRALPEFHAASLYARNFSSLEEQLACIYAMPLWIASLWMECYGLEETLALLDASQEPAPSGLRLNRLRPDWRETRETLLRTCHKGDMAQDMPVAGRNRSTGPEAAAVAAGLPLLRQARMAENPVDGERDAAPPDAEVPGTPGVMAVGICGLAFDGSLPWQAKILLQDGGATRQSAASYDALEALAPESWPGPVWDCCAGSGGKTLVLLEMGVPVALAGDTSCARLERLRAALTLRKEELASSGAALPLLLAGSALDWRPASSASPANPATGHTERLPDAFGTVLIDAPCSGLGTLARRPEIRLRRVPQDAATLVVAQRGLLDAAAGHLRPGGCIAYITCTRNPAENEEQIAYFLSAHPGSRLETEYATPANSPLREFFYGARIRL